MGLIYLITRHRRVMEPYSKGVSQCCVKELPVASIVSIVHGKTNKYKKLVSTTTQLAPDSISPCHPLRRDLGATYSRGTMHIECRGREVNHQVLCSPFVLQ